MNKKLIRKMQTASGGPIKRLNFSPEFIASIEQLATRVPGTKTNSNYTVGQPNIGYTKPISTSRVLLGKGVESDEEYTKRRIQEETNRRTWRSEAADIAHGIREGVLALHPYTAIPYYGAKVGQDFLNGTYGWHTALNASIPLFHFQSLPVAGFREATNVALEDAANAGSKTARNWRVAREINLTTKNTKLNNNSTVIPHEDLFDFWHGGLEPDFNFENLDVFRKASKQSKRNRNYAGFYMYSTPRLLGAFNYGFGEAHGIKLKPGAKKLKVNFNTERIEALELLNYKNQGYDYIEGKDVWGAPEYILLNKDAIQHTGFFDHSLGHNIYILRDRNVPKIDLSINNLPSKTSLKFFERPSKLSEAERAGMPKGDRNNKKSINPDNVYGNLRFIRNIDGLPTIKQGLVQLGNPDKLLTNFTTDLPFRLHPWYPNIPGSTYITVSPRAFKGKKFYSIKPSDSFLATIDSKVTPNQVRIISGDPKILEEAERRGMRTLTSDKLQDLFNAGSEITKKEFELGRNGAVRSFANADRAIDDFKFRNHFYGEDIPEVLSKYSEGVVTPYRAEVDRLITQNIGRPSVKDYLTLENMTGLNSGITNKFDPEFIKNAKDPLANKDMFEKVYYPVTSQIEEELMNSIGLYSGPYYSFSNLLKLNKLKGDPIKKKQGGKMNIIELLKNGSGIHIKKKNRGKFTSYCHGKVTDACIRKAKASGNPTLVKRATFAANARKWQHKMGGILKASDGSNTKNWWSKATDWLGNNKDLLQTGFNAFSSIGNIGNASKALNNFDDETQAGLNSLNGNIDLYTNMYTPYFLNNNPDVQSSNIDLVNKAFTYSKNIINLKKKEYLLNRTQSKLLYQNLYQLSINNFSSLLSDFGLQAFLNFFPKADKTIDLKPVQGVSIIPQESLKMNIPTLPSEFNFGNK